MFPSLSLLFSDSEAEKKNSPFSPSLLTLLLSPPPRPPPLLHSKTDAGKIAGLEVLRIINEPTAASLAYGFEKKSNETILVFDLGGGTFDVSVLEVGDGVFEVLSTSGDTHLGGDDFDKRVVDWLAADFKANEGIDLIKDRQALQRLTEAAEKAKMELSSTTQTSISLPFITATAEGPKHIEASLTRAKFEELCSDLLDRCRVPVEQALKDGTFGFPPRAERQRQRQRQRRSFLLVSFLRVPPPPPVLPPDAHSCLLPPLHTKNTRQQPASSSPTSTRSSWWEARRASRPSRSSSRSSRARFVPRGRKSEKKGGGAESESERNEIREDSTRRSRYFQLTNSPLFSLSPDLETSTKTNRNPTSRSTRTRSSPWEPPSRRASWRARSATSCCSTSRRSRSASRRSAAS